MKITERVAKLLLRIKQGDQRPFADEYLAGLLVEVRGRQDNAHSKDDMLRAQGQARLLKQMFDDIERSDQVLTKLQQQPRRTQ